MTDKKLWIVTHVTPCATETQSHLKSVQWKFVDVQRKKFQSQLQIELHFRQKVLMGVDLVCVCVRCSSLSDLSAEQQFYLSAYVLIAATK